jgi:hypothetical protein
MGKHTKNLNYFSALLLFFNLLMGFEAAAEIQRPLTPHLEVQEKESLRYHLEGLFNDVDLIIKNRKSRNADLKRQERDLAFLKVYERIPFKRNISALEKNLKETARDYQIQLLQFKVSGYSKPGKPLRKSQFADEPRLQIQPDQLVEEIHIQLIVKGDPEKIRNWTQAWRQEQMRLVELETSDPSPSIRSVTSNQWEIRARAFRFRKIQYPNLIPRNQKEFLPQWAKKEPKHFASAEPLLWSFVSKTEALIPQAKPLYQTRSQMFLNDFRMNFFLSKASPN